MSLALALFVQALLNGEIMHNGSDCSLVPTTGFAEQSRHLIMSSRYYSSYRITIATCGNTRIGTPSRSISITLSYPR